MSLLKAINAVIYFLLELSMLASLGYAGFRLVQLPVGRYLLAVGLPVVVAVLWGFFLAPRSAHRLPDGPRYILAALFFGIAFFLLYRSGSTRLAVGLGVTAAISQSIAIMFKQ